MKRFLLVLFLLVSGCSPSVSPLYRDFEVRPVTETEPASLDAIEAALEEAGWEPADTNPPGGIATEMRTLRHWGLYRVVVMLEAVPVGERYVRLFIHPYRKYITGGRGKIPYLNTSLRRSILPDIREAFERRGLIAVGTPMERDKVKASNF